MPSLFHAAALLRMDELIVVVSGSWKVTTPKGVSCRADMSVIHQLLSPVAEGRDTEGRAEPRHHNGPPIEVAALLEA